MSQSVEREVLDFTFAANSDMSSTSGGPGPNTSYQFTAVILTSTDFTCDKATANAACIGINQIQPSAGQGATVRLHGISQMIVDGFTGAAITPGTRLKADSSGRGVPITADKDNIIAIALQNSTAQNDQIAVFVTQAQASQ